MAADDPTTQRIDQVVKKIRIKIGALAHDPSERAEGERRTLHWVLGLLTEAEQ